MSASPDGPSLTVVRHTPHMPSRKRPNIEASRLAVLATTDDDAFVEHAADLLASGDRLGREATLDVLVERPNARVRDALRMLFLDLAADGSKRDQGGVLRERVAEVFCKMGDVRDADVGLVAARTRETIFGDDATWKLRAHGVRLLAATSPDLFPYAATELLDDAAHDGEPARTAFQLLADAGHFVPIYQWLLRADPSGPLVPGVFELLLDAPPQVVERYVSDALVGAIDAGNETLAMSLCETIVRREFSACYAAIGEAMFRRMSDELYTYLAMLLAGANRPALLALLDEQLHRGRRPRLVVEAMRVRPTAESDAIVKRWEEGG